MMPVEFELNSKQISAEQMWALLEWCSAHGADDFTLTLEETKRGTPSFDRICADLAAFQLPDAKREHSVWFLWNRVRKARLWKLSPESIAVLQRVFRENLFNYPVGGWDEGIVENPTFYRRGEIMMAVISHEASGFMRLNDDETAEFAKLGVAIER